MGTGGGLPSFPMSPNRDSNRRYSDEEVRLLLKRAAELESQAGTVPARTDGPTLADLEAIASEAGISPGLVRQAARELDSGGPSLPEVRSPAETYLGAPLAIELERVVEGEASDAVLEQLLPSIQRAADGMGQPSLLRRTLNWQSTDAQRARILQVSVSVGRGQTRLLVEERYGNLAGGLFSGLLGGVGGGVGLGVGFGVGIGALGSALFATLFPIAMFGGAYVGARAIYQSFVGRRVKVLRRLMNDLVGIVEDGLEEERARLGPGA